MHTHPRVLSNIWRLGQVRNSKFGMNVSSENPINAAKSQVYSRVKITPIAPTQIK